MSDYLLTNATAYIVTNTYTKSCVVQMTDRFIFAPSCTVQAEWLKGFKVGGYIHPKRAYAPRVIAIGEGHWIGTGR